MKILLDARTVGPRIHGIARYGLNLLQAMANLDHPYTIYVIGQDKSFFPFLKQGKSKLHFLRVRVPPYSLQEQILLPWIVGRVHPDIYHCLTYACPVFVPSHLLFTLHDLLPLIRPIEFRDSVKFYYRTFVRAASIRASRIIVDSHYSAFWCAQLFGTPAERISLVPLGGDHIGTLCSDRHGEEELLHVHLKGHSYFLCIANARPHKRVLFLVKLFLSESTLEERDVHLVLVGGQHPEVHSWVAQHDHRSRIHTVGHVSDALLVALYQKAMGLLCPSVGEGFGLPVLEAMYSGIPVVASHDGGVAELLEEVGLLLPPDEEEAWRRAMSEIARDPQKGKTQGALAASKAATYSWQRTAIETLRVYEEVLGIS